MQSDNKNYLGEIKTPKYKKENLTTLLSKVKLIVLESHLSNQLGENGDFELLGFWLVNQL